jgi:hypothetical protein
MRRFVSGFYFRLIVLTAIVAVAGPLLFHVMNWPQPRVYHFIVTFYFVFTAIIHWWLSAALRKNARRFPAYFMGATTIKLFASMVFIVLYAIKNPVEAKVFLVTFFLIYLIYTAFETTEILHYSSQIRKNSQPGKPH